MNPILSRQTLTWLVVTMALLCPAPSSRAQVPEDARWDYRFAVAGTSGPDGIPMAMAFDGTNTYLGGTFQSVGQTLANGVARFDGHRVWALPNGPQQDPSLINILTMAMFQGRLYVGGFFTNVGGSPAGGLGCWDGAQWSVPNSCTGQVLSLGADAKGLVVAGNFALPGFTNPVALARWDGRNWTVLNSELVPTPEAVMQIDAVGQTVLVGDDIYAAVQFHWIDGRGDYPAWLVVKCNQDDAWAILPPPEGDFSGFDYSYLANFRGQLVVAGSFTNASNPGIRNIAIYDGNDWQPLGQGLDFNICNLAGDDHYLYVSYRSSPYGQIPVYAVSRWDGTNWSLLGTNHFRTDWPYASFIAPDGSLYVIGDITNTEDEAVPGVAHWTGSRWEPFLTGEFHGLSGYAPTVRALATFQGSLYAGGIFTAAGRQIAEGLARWDGAGWHSVAGPLQSQRPTTIHTLASSGPLLFAGGSFTNIGGVAASNVAAWDGSQWSSLGAGLPGYVYALTWWNDSLYAGGLFLPPDGAPTFDLARWNGAAWEVPGGGCDNVVEALASWHDDLFVGGSFLTAGDVLTPGLARWDGTVWHEVGGGLVRSEGDEFDNPTVRAILPTEDGLYVAGNFIMAGSLPATNIARWDGTNWHSVGGGLAGQIEALANRGRTIFAAGALLNAAGEDIGGVARWNGTNWTCLGSGIRKPGRTPWPHALVATEEDLYVGGMFTQAGGKPSVGLARWMENPHLSLELDRTDFSGSTRLRATSDPGLRFEVQSSPDLWRWWGERPREPGPGADGAPTFLSACSC